MQISYFNVNDFIQTNSYFRTMVRNAVRANEHDAVIFTGSGVTAAVHKLINALDLKTALTVVFVGPYEHHSNLLPWREIAAFVRLCFWFEKFI